MALPIAAQENVRFVATDRVDGFFEGFTQHAELGRYQVRDKPLLTGFRVEHNGQSLDRRQHVASAQLLPNQLLTRYAPLIERLSVVPGQRALVMSWQGADDEAIAAVLRFPPALAIAEIKTVAPGVWRVPLSFADESWQLVIAAESSATLQTHVDDGGSDRLLRIVRTAGQRELNVRLAFATDASAALAMVQQLPDHDGIQRLLAQQLASSELLSSDPEFNRALRWASFSAQSLVVEEFGKGIWAGLPWFRDNWGRDTFIALPGTLLVNGRFAEAKAVLDNFARYQKRGALTDPEYGRIPNRVAAGTQIIYNTVDGTPWLIREVLEYMRYSGDEAYGQQMLPLIREYLRGVERHWLDENGLLTHDDADTWMDARIENQEAWSPRGNRAVEIQALWYTALDVAAILSERAGQVDDANRYRQQAERVRLRFPALFWDGRRMADRLQADGKPDFSVRPNQLMLISIPFSDFVTDTVQAQITRNAVSSLLYPHGIASLNPADPNFHPKHENPAYHHKDAAYHNGTIWGWNAGFTITALNKFGYQDLAWLLTRNLTAQILTADARGSMSELVDALPDGNGRVTPSGTYSQAWSVSEFVRNAYQDYLGFRPDLLRNVLHFVPALPAAWQSVTAKLPIGRDERLGVNVQKTKVGWRWQFTPALKQSRELSMDLLANDGSRQRLRFAINDRVRTVQWDGAVASVDAVVQPTIPVMASQRAVMGELQLLKPEVYRADDYPMLRGKDVLKTKIRSSAGQRQP